MTWFTREGRYVLRKALTDFLQGWIPSYQQRQSRQMAESQYEHLRRLYKRPKFRWPRARIQ